MKGIFIKREGGRYGKFVNYVADKFDLRRDIQIKSRVKSAVYDEQANRWEVQLESGQRARAQFVIAAVGVLSARYVPPFDGIDRFTGESYHTSRWPKETVNLAGKRVAVIGTGATAVQLIPIIAKEVGHLAEERRAALSRSIEFTGFAENVAANNYAVLRTA
jgi:cation diffusion facilitator CzcD-associated flavoprotein CzcO